MVRSSAASDVFTAMAEGRRRAIFRELCGGERPVGEVAGTLGIDQPSVSKHLRVLRDVGLVSVRREGKKRYYAARPGALEPMTDWLAECERHWERHLDAIQRRAEDAARNERGERE